MRSNTFFSAALGELIISEGFSFSFCGELPSFMLFRRRWCEVVDDVSDSVMATRFSKLIGHIDKLFFSQFASRGIAECGCERVVVKIVVEVLFYRRNERT
jgi:hypothetical protein